MSYVVQLREVAPMKAMTIRFITNMQTISQDMVQAYGELWQHLEKHGGVFTGECFDLYHGEGFDPNRIDVECGLSVVTLLSETDRIKARSIAGGIMASTMHKGPYEGLEAAFAAVMAWMEQHDYVPLAGMRDYYRNDPAQVPPEELLTEVFWPVKKKV